MTDFWRDCGFGLLEREENGFLRVTDDFLRAYFKRPEIRPIEESCDAERKLHDALLRNPRQAASDQRLAELADPDARENYQIVLAFRDRLVAAGTVEGCYLNLFREASGSAGGIPVPPLFVDQMTHVILRNILDGVEEPLRARAGEMFFRPQKVTINDGHIMAGDEEIVEMYANSGGFGSLGQLLVEAQTPLRTIDLDVLTIENAEMYWLRDQKYDTVLNLNFSGDGLDALCRVLEAWVQHFLDVAVSIQPVQQITDERWVWHIGLEQEGTRLLNDLYQGVDVGDVRLARLLSLFRLDFADPQEMQPDIAGRPVYLALATNEQGVVRLKPQNLLVNLPVAAKAS